MPRKAYQLSLAVCVCVCVCSLVQARQWVNQHREVADAEIVEILGKYVVFQDDEGREYKYPMEQLSPQDMAYAKQWERRTYQNTSIVARELRGRLVVAEAPGFRTYVFDPPVPEYYLLYYTATDSESCELFTPKLMEFYKENNKDEHPFEVILISFDSTEKQMYKYMRQNKITWPALRHSMAKRTPFATQFAGPGIPDLVVLDRSGHVLFDSYKKNRYIGPERVLKFFKKMLDGDVNNFDYGITKK